jgi:hypothetical protein
MENSWIENPNGGNMI